MNPTTNTSAAIDSMADALTKHAPWNPHQERNIALLTGEEPTEVRARWLRRYPMLSQRRGMNDETALRLVRIREHTDDAESWENSPWRGESPGVSPIGGFMPPSLDADGNTVTTAHTPVDPDAYQRDPEAGAECTLWEFTVADHIGRHYSVQYYRGAAGEFDSWAVEGEVWDDLDGPFWRPVALHHPEPA